MPVDPAAVLTWTCCQCHRPVNDGDGCLSTVPEIARHYLDLAGHPLPWLATHDDCATPWPDGPGYWLEVAEIRTANSLALANERIGRKTWMKWTNWSAVLGAQGVLTAITQPFDPAAPLAPGLPLTGNGFLAWVFKRAEAAGWGIANGSTFEAFPGLEHAAADYVNQVVNDLFKED